MFLSTVTLSDFDNVTTFLRQDPPHFIFLLGVATRIQDNQRKKRKLG